jgi:hypothetical protein
LNSGNNKRRTREGLGSKDPIKSACLEMCKQNGRNVPSINISGNLT